MLKNIISENKDAAKFITIVAAQVAAVVIAQTVVRKIVEKILED